MKKTIRLTALLASAALLSASVIVGCGGGDGDEGSANGGGGGSSAGKKFLKLGTAPVGGAFFQVGDALAQVVNEKKGEGVGKFTSTATKGSQQNIRDIDKGDLDFALSNAAITYFAVRGEGAWDKKYDVKAVMTLAPNVAMFIALKSSKIESIADLKGKRVTVGPAGAGFEYFVGPILKEHGVTFDDFDKLNATQSGAVDNLGDGATDAAFLGGAVPTSSIIQACSTHDIQFVPFDGQVRLKLIEEYPFFHPASIPAGTYDDLKEDFEGLNVGSMHLITTGNQDEELVYQFTKIVYENREEVVKKHAAGKAINPKNVIRNTGTEFHPGAVRFYKEIGIWPEESEEAADDATSAEEKPAEKKEEGEEKADEPEKSEDSAEKSEPKADSPEEKKDN